VFVDGNSIIVTTSAATKSPEESAEVLQQMKKDMEATLEKIKVEGSVEDLEKAMVNLQKVSADIRLVKLKHVR
jgi:capsular polysaccharide biosynthesis protein